MQPIKWVDEFYDHGSRTVLTNNELKIDGVTTFGRHFLGKAIAGLQQHYHEGCLELTYIAKGNVLFQVGETEYKLSGGDVFIALPDEVHSTGTMPLSLNEMYWVQLDMREAAPFLFLDGAAAGYLKQGLFTLNNRVIKTDTKEMHDLLRRFFEKVYQKQGANRFAAAGYLVMFLHRLLEYDKQIQFTLTADIARATEYILDHLEESIGLEALAADCNLSLSRFKQKFKQQLGVPPREFINHRKIELAKGMLLENSSITDVALGLGFSTSNYFSVVFKRYTTYTPTEYVALHREDA